MLTIRTMVGPSRIEGNGLYAGEFIPTGGIVSKWVEGLDRTFPLDYPNKLPLQAQETFMKNASCDGQAWYLLGDDGIYFNHSDNPNVCIVPGKNPAAMSDYVALRDILPGEELTMDYREIGIE